MEFDIARKVTLGFGVLTIAFSMILILFHLVAVCCPLSALYSRDRAYITAALILLCICQWLILILLRSGVCRDNILVKELRTCSIARGATVSISTCVPWFVVVVASILLHKMLRDGRREYENEEYSADQPLIQ